VDGGAANYFGRVAVDVGYAAAGIAETVDVVGSAGSAASSAVVVAVDVAAS